MSSEDRKEIDPRVATALLAALVLAVSAAGIAWIGLDTRPHPFGDPYPQKTLRFIDRVAAEGVSWQAIEDMSLQGRSPLYQLLGVPFVLVFGRSMDSLLLLNVLLFAVLLLAVYGLGQRLGGRSAGLLAAFVVACYPPLVNLSHVAKPNFAVPVSVAVSLWLLCWMLESRSRAVAWAFGLSLGLGMLMRHFFVFHLPLLAVGVGVYMILWQEEPRRPAGWRRAPGWLWSRLRDPFVLQGLLPAALLAAGLTAFWYVGGPGLELQKLARTVDAIPITVTRGLAETLDHSFAWYALTAPAAISWPFSLLFLFALVSALVRRRPLELVLVASVLVSYTLLGLQKGLGWQRYAAALPVIGTLTAVAVLAVRGRLARRLLVAACLLFGLFNAAVVWGGAPGWVRPAARALGSPLDQVTPRRGHQEVASTAESLFHDACSWRINCLYCPNPPAAEDWRVGDVLDAVLEDPRCHAAGCGVVIVSRHEAHHPRLFDYQLVQDHPSLADRVVFKAILPWFPDQRMRGLDWLDEEYLVYIREWSSDRAAAAVSRLLEEGVVGLQWLEVARELALPDGTTVRLMRRARAPTAEETMAVIDRLRLPEVVLPLTEGLLRRDPAAPVGELLARVDLAASPSVGRRLGVAYRALAESLLAGGREEEAVAALERSLAADPAAFAAANRLAGLYLRRREWRRAATVSERALELAPDRARRGAGLRLARVRAELGDTAAACRVLAGLGPIEDPAGALAAMRRRYACPGEIGG